MSEQARSAPVSQQRVIRAFISSTFRDMQTERDILIKKIFPQLRKLCEERAVTWTEVDLRWGITDEQKAEGKVLPLCLEEIHRCRPYFIGLLGERYGWVSDSIPAELLESQHWLNQHLQHSVTELEILHGVFSEKQMVGHAYFYFRDPKYLESVPAEKRQDFTAENAKSAEKLRKLKQKIRAARDEQICELRDGYANPEQLGDWVLVDFTKLINTLYPKDQTPDPLDQEAARHEAYAQSRRLAFIGREDLLRRLDGYASTDGKPLVLTGESGCGKSALLAEWVARWRKKHPDDPIIQHYIGSTPDSADWQGLVRRILGELKRAFSITDDIPLQPDALRPALNDWTVKAAGLRRVILVLDALNQLADDGAARQLSWLPLVFPTNFRVLVSTLPSESLDALRKRGWPELNVPLFARADIAPAALSYFKIFSKNPPLDIVTKLESTPAACNALYLRAVLDELRQFGKHEELKAKADGYLSAPDLPDLFDRILTRWHDDFGKDPEHPEIVYRSLSLIACARFGLAEAELLDLLGKNGEPLPRQFWTPFYLAIENALALRSGLLNFGHDWLRATVRKRWLKDAESVRAFHQQLAEYFAELVEPTNRKLDELPILLRVLEQWEKLKDLLADVPTFLRLRETDRWKWERIEHWLPLRQHYDAGEVYRTALDKWMRITRPNERREAFVFAAVAIFHMDSGDYESAEPLFCRALIACERVLGHEHVETLENIHNLACLLQHKGDDAGAEPLYRRALEISNRVLGREHLETLMTMHNLASLLAHKGDDAAAESLFRNAVNICTRVWGHEHRQTLLSENGLALLQEKKGDYASAERLLRHALGASERALGLEHPYTLGGVTNLAALLEKKGDYSEAESLYRRALEVSERILGPEHRITLAVMDGIALLLARKKSDYAGAESLIRRVLDTRELRLGLDHPDTLRSLNSLAMLLEARGDHAGAEALHRRALKSREQVLGPEHPATLESINNLAGLLESLGDYAGAEPLYRRALEVSERVFGQEHFQTLVGLNNLAWLLESKGEYERAEPLLRRALEGILKKSASLGHSHPHLDTFVGNYARLLAKTGCSQSEVLAQLNIVAQRFGIRIGGQVH